MIFNQLHVERKCVARFISPAAVCWLNLGLDGRVLHVFDRSCNLINKEGDILSLVAAELGPGPFAITIELTGPPRRDMLGIWDEASVFSRVRYSPDQIQIGSIRIDLSKGTIWNPKPAWEDITPANLKKSGHKLDQLFSSHSPPPIAFGYSKNGENKSPAVNLTAAWCELSAGLQEYDLIRAKEGAKGLAGLGSGLTPAGDDFLMGIIYSLLSNWDAKKAHDWAIGLVNAAAPRTTRLSASWLEAAADGQAAEPWHRLVEAMIDDNSHELVEATARILATGHSSGADALAGYVAGLRALSII